MGDKGNLVERRSSCRHSLRIPLHLRVLRDPAFLSGDIHTGYLDQFLSAEQAAAAERVAAGLPGVEGERP